MESEPSLEKSPPLIPTAVQYELTYACNNACRFCYNRFSREDSSQASTNDVKVVLNRLVQSGVLSVNLNGGEPLMRRDFFDIAEYASAIGLGLHLNTNCTRIGTTEAKHIAKSFDSVCTTLLSWDANIHDELSGRRGAHAEAQSGILALQDAGVYVAVNVPLCSKNACDIIRTLTYLRSIQISTALITRMISWRNDPNELQISDEDLAVALGSILEMQAHTPFHRMAFPQPFPPCKFAYKYREAVKKHNIPCTIGLNTARVTPRGNVTPCTLVSRPLLGNVTETPFRLLWERFNGRTFFESCLPFRRCEGCIDIDSCGGGCFGCTQPDKAQS